MKKMFIMNLLFLSVLLLINWRCNPCIPIPEKDDTAPSIGLTIEYNENGETRTISLNPTDPSVTITADVNSPVMVIYTGQDNEGLKSIHLGITVITKNGPLTQTQEWERAPIEVSCPKKWLIGYEKFTKRSINETIELSASATNWLGSSTFCNIHKITFRE